MGLKVCKPVTTLKILGRRYTIVEESLNDFASRQAEMLSSKVLMMIGTWVSTSPYRALIHQCVSATTPT